MNGHQVDKSADTKRNAARNTGTPVMRFMHPASDERKGAKCAVFRHVTPCSCLKFIEISGKFRRWCEHFHRKTKLFSVRLRLSHLRIGPPSKQQLFIDFPAGVVYLTILSLTQAIESNGNAIPHLRPMRSTG
jgi:hypothetical protein